MSCTADRNHLFTIVPLTIMNACTVIINKLIIKIHACIKVIKKFGMTFPKNRTYRVCPKFAETEIN